MGLVARRRWLLGGNCERKKNGTVQMNINICKLENMGASLCFGLSRFFMWRLFTNNYYIIYARPPKLSLLCTTDVRVFCVQNCLNGNKPYLEYMYLFVRMLKEKVGAPEVHSFKVFSIQEQLTRRTNSSGIDLRSGGI